MCAHKLTELLKLLRFLQNASLWRLDLEVKKIFNLHVQMFISHFVNDFKRSCIQAAYIFEYNVYRVKNRKITPENKPKRCSGSFRFYPHTVTMLATRTSFREQLRPCLVGPWYQHTASSYVPDGVYFHMWSVTSGQPQCNSQCPERSTGRVYRSCVRKKNLN